MYSIFQTRFKNFFQESINLSTRHRGTEKYYYIISSYLIYIFPNRQVDEVNLRYIFEILHEKYRATGNSTYIRVNVTIATNLLKDVHLTIKVIDYFQILQENPQFEHLFHLYFFFKKNMMILFRTLVFEIQLNSIRKT